MTKETKAETKGPTTATLPLFRKVLLFFAVFDTLLGPGSLLIPDAYLGIMHASGASEMTGLLARTATLWTIFAVAEWFAFLRPHAAAIALVAVFRFIDIPADLVYLAAGKNLSVVGSLILVAAPIVNALGGVYLWRIARRKDAGA